MMKEILGFIVLTSPLFLILLWVPVCVGLAVWIGRKIFKKGKTVTGVVVGLLVFLFVMAAPVADEIAGRIYFNHLCETEAGVKVYQTIELPAEYWDEEGRPKFMNSRGVLDTEVLGTRFEWKRRTSPIVSNFIRIDKEEWILFDNRNSRELGEMLTFFRYFGWTSKLSPAPNVAVDCQSMWKGELSQNIFMSQIFVAPVNTSGGKNGNNK